MTAYPRFVVATPARSVCDDHARSAYQRGWLRLYALWTRRGTIGIPPEMTRLCTALGMASYMAARTLSSFSAESFRFRLHPLFDRWVTSLLQPGDFLMSSYGYANESFAWVRKHGGKTFLDAGNSHPQNFWDILTEEHHRWNYPFPPVAHHHYERSLEMMEHVDYVFSPSSFVSCSFLERGFYANQILHLPYLVDLNAFHPSRTPRPKNRPLSVITTGSLSLRKGTPYLLEAMRIVRREVPDARLLLTRSVASGMKGILGKYQDLEIDWAEPLPHEQLVTRLHQGDIFVLPSLEEGMARTALEAMACGLPTVLTPNCGTNDLIIEEINGSVVPIRDPQKLADAILSWWTRIQRDESAPTSRLIGDFSYEGFSTEFQRMMKPLLE